MTIQIDYEAKDKLALDYEKIINKVVEAAIDYEECPFECDVNVVLTDNERIHEVNKEFRDMDKPTDVLSFPMVEYSTPSEFDQLEDYDEFFHPETGELLLGDIMISIDKVKEQADNYGHSLERELGFLVAHSMLHLFGYDHMEEEERVVMETKQEEILQEIGLTR